MYIHCILTSMQYKHTHTVYIVRADGMCNTWLWIPIVLITISKRTQMCCDTNARPFVLL